MYNEEEIEMVKARYTLKILHQDLVGNMSLFSRDVELGVVCIKWEYAP